MGDVVTSEQRASFLMSDEVLELHEERVRPVNAIGVGNDADMRTTNSMSTVEGKGEIDARRFVGSERKDAGGQVRGFIEANICDLGFA